jgi:hypothetical protein
VIIDVNTGEEINWGEIFFLLHKHCNLNKWEIWEYTLPQIAELIKQTNKYIEYEVKINSLPLKVFGAFVDGGEEEPKSTTDDGYQVATADDIDLLAQFLGGGL